MGDPSYDGQRRLVSLQPMEQAKWFSILGIEPIQYLYNLENIYYSAAIYHSIHAVHELGIPPSRYFESY